MVRKILSVTLIALVTLGLGACIIADGGTPADVTTEAPETAPTTLDTSEATQAPTSSQTQEDTEPSAGSAADTTTTTTAPSSKNQADTTTTTTSTSRNNTPSDRLPQKAMYKNTDFYKSLKSGVYYLEVVNQMSGKKPHDIVLADTGSQKYFGFSADGTAMSIYTTDKNKNMVARFQIPIMGKFYVPSTPMPDDLKSAFDGAKDWTEMGKYMKTTEDGGEIVEHYQDGDKIKRVIFKNENGTIGDVIGLETHGDDGFAKATIKTFHTNPPTNLFTTAGYRDISKVKNVTVPDFKSFLPGNN
ncbi:MAG: hypothetical protein FWG82_04020 [Oscillospiraceae bacterium]|nr:hypothetical protein [Oscillospiraceae bacterium]